MHEDQDVPDLVTSNPAPNTVTRQASDSSMESGKWSFFQSSSTSDVKKACHDKQERPNEDHNESIYFENYSSNLKNQAAPSNGKKLWGRMKDNEKWKDLIAEKKEESSKSGKLWERIVHATMSVEEENGPDSDDDDWEGETHVSRILREYHQSVSKGPLPDWLYDHHTPISTSASHLETDVIQNQATMDRKKSCRTRRLWQPPETQHLSSREKEIQALRTARQNHPSEDYYKKSSVFRSQSERTPSHYSQSTENGSNQIYGSTTPRRVNTARLPPPSHYYDKETSHNIPSKPSPRPIRDNAYYF
ncbi:hypothetical protein [Parasitella parasitica]|uniref:Mso1 N-terminal domain-containing protein n=1 Tax=Parasitella parasitica TaxID=35722 RepID=A0A0B7N7V4_9FUNG|nr:hypothetical protein [Parasitella parasitica]